MSTPKISSASTRPPPSRWWYAFALLLVLCGVGFMAAFLVPRIMALPDSLQQAVMPGSVDVEVTEPATFTIFHEAHSVVNGEVITSPSVDGLRIKVVGPDGGPVEVVPSKVSSKYSVGGRSGRAIFSFDAKAAGRYQVSGGYKSEATEPRVVLAIGSNFVRGLLITIAGALGILLVGFTVGGLIALMAWRKRKMHKKMLATVSD